MPCTERATAGEKAVTGPPRALVVIVLLLFMQVAAAQTEEIIRIRDYYNNVKEHLDDEYGLYRTEISINTGDQSYPALGNYFEKIVYYWGSEAGYSWPVLVTWTGEYAAHNEYGEVLFSEPSEPWEGETGEFVFQFVSFDNSDDIITESRWWFSGGELLQSSGQTTYPSGVIEFIPELPGEYDYGHNHVELMELFEAIHH